MGSKQDTLCRKEDIEKTQELIQNVAESKEIKITSTVILCISITQSGKCYLLCFTNEEAETL